MAGAFPPCRRTCTNVHRYVKQLSAPSAVSLQNPWQTCKQMPMHVPLYDVWRGTLHCDTLAYKTACRRWTEKQHDPVTWGQDAYPGHNNLECNIQCLHHKHITCMGNTQCHPCPKHKDLVCNTGCCTSSLMGNTQCYNTTTLRPMHRMHRMHRTPSVGTTTVITSASWVLCHVQNTRTSTATSSVHTKITSASWETLSVTPSNLMIWQIWAHPNSPFNLNTHSDVYNNLHSEPQPCCPTYMLNLVLAWLMPGTCHLFPLSHRPKNFTVSMCFLSLILSSTTHWMTFDTKNQTSFKLCCVQEVLLLCSHASDGCILELQQIQESHQKRYISQE